MILVLQILGFKIENVQNFNISGLLDSEILLLSSDIRSERSIAIVKKFDFDFFVIFDSILLPHSKNVF